MKIFTLLTALFLKTIIAYNQNASLNDTSQNYFMNGHYAKAKQFAEQKVKMYQLQNDTTSQNYVSALNQLGCINYAMSYFNQAISLYNKALLVQRKVANAKPLDSAEILINLSEVYYFIEQYQQAETYINTVSRLYNNQTFENNEYVKYLINKGNIQAKKWQWEDAEKNIKNAVELGKKINGANSAEYAHTLYQLAYLYYRMSLTNDAEKQIVQALEVQKKITGENNPVYALYLSHFVRNQFRMDIYEPNEKILKKIITIQKATLPENHIEYIISLHSLGYLYCQLDKLKMADSLITFTTPFFKPIYTEKGARYLNGIINGAEIKQRLKDYKAADSLNRLYLSIITKDSLQQTNHTNFVQVLNNLGWLNYMIGNNTKADSCFTLGYKIISEYSGVLNRDYLNSCNGLAQLNFQKKNYKAVQDNILKYINTENKLLLDKLEFLSQTELLNYVAERENTLAFPFSVIKKYPSPTLIKEVYNNRLLFSGVTLQNSVALIKQIYTCSDTGLKALWNNYQIAKFELLKIIAFPNPEKNPRFNIVNENADLLEKQLLRQSANYRSIKEKTSITWSDVKQHLKLNEIAIEFVKYKKFNKVFTNTIQYAAMVITPYDTAPIFITLCSENQLQSALDNYAYKGIVRGNINTSVQPLQQVYQLILKPIEKYLKSTTTTIYYTPDGLLHQLSFAAIPYQNNNLLCNKYNLIQLSSTRQIVLDKLPQDTSYTIALFGGVNYNKQTADTVTSSSNNFYSFAKKRGSTSISSFNYLPHTLTEVNNIAKTAIHFNKTVIVNTKENATEAMFKNLGGSQSPQVIHIATHGFTFPTITYVANHKQINNFIEANNPLMRCGLVMAGGNLGWKGKNLPTQDDGILTGVEISNVPLPNTQLVVLSACETALGKLQGSEGVFGLQRAFKIAGANYVMASLWQVPDKETAEFMQTFYNQLLSSKKYSVQDAFIKTQRTMGLKYPPYYWAAFTLVH